MWKDANATGLNRRIQNGLYMEPSNLLKVWGHKDRRCREKEKCKQFSLEALRSEILLLLSVKKKVFYYSRNTTGASVCTNIHPELLFYLCFINKEMEAYRTNTHRMT